MAYTVNRDGKGKITSISRATRDASGNFPAGEILADDHAEVIAFLNPSADPWDAIRAERERRIAGVEWRIGRYLSEVRQGLTPTEPIGPLDTYIQALRDIPQTYSMPESVVWPTEPAA